MRKIEILETTLRDGSYTINDQFTAKDTEYISRILDEIGFEYIEIGPGIGLNASEHSSFKPACSDIEYIRSAKKHVKNAKIGAFFIPDIGRKEDIYMASQNGLDFLRCGINVIEYKKAFEYIEYSKKQDLITALNFMKSYVVKPKEFAQISNEAYKAGADMVYLVDSAGGMLPSEVKEYVEEVKNLNPDIKLGFHGHNNLSLSMANTLQAIESGIDIVDTTIRGIGRSSGNTVTEKLILILSRMGYSVDYDLDKLFEFSEQIISPLLSGKSESSIDYILGYSQFHSSFLSSIDKISKEYKLDPKELIIAYSNIDKVNMDESKLKDIAILLSKTNTKNNFIYKIATEIKYENNIKKQIEILKKEFIEIKNKYNKLIFFNLVKQYRASEIKLSPVIHSSECIVFGSAELTEDVQINEFIHLLENHIDGFLIDNRLISSIDINIDGEIFFYNDAMLFSKSIYNYLKTIRSNFSNLNNLYLDINYEINAFLIKNIESLGFILIDDIKYADIAVIGQNYYSTEDIIKCKNLKWLLLASSEHVDTQAEDLNKDINLIRIDLQREIFSEISENLSYKKLISEEYGEVLVNGKYYCSGGYIGRKGSVVVDNINNIKKTFGISNGDGSITYR